MIDVGILTPINVFVGFATYMSVALIRLVKIMKKIIGKIKTFLENLWDGFGSFLMVMLIFTGFGLLWWCIEGLFPRLRQPLEDDMDEFYNNYNNE